MKQLLIATIFTLFTINANAQKLDGEFSKLDISGHYKVILTYAEKCSVEVVCTDKKLEGNLKMKIKDNKLILGVNGKTKKNNKDKLIAYVSMPCIASAKLSGMSSVKCSDTFELDHFVCDLSGMTSIDIDLNCQNLSIDVSGMSSAKLTGASQDAKLKASGMSEINCKDMSIKTGKVDISGMSKVSSNIDNARYVNVTGMSNYKNLTSE